MREGETLQPMPTSASVVLSNVYSDANKGGAAITEITARFARRVVPGARLVLITVASGDKSGSSDIAFAKYDGADLTRVSPILQTPGGFATVLGLLKGVVRLLVPRTSNTENQAASEVAKATLVISKGGYLFGHRPRLRFLLALFVSTYPLLYARRIGVPTVVYSASVGPFSGRLHRMVAGSILRRVSVVAVRDSASERRALNLGVSRDRLISMPDCVFSWDQRYRGIDESEERSTRLAFVLRDIGPNREFLPVLESVFVRLAEDGVFSAFEGVIQTLEDRAVTEQFVNRLVSLGLNATMFETHAADPAELLDIYRRSAATVSTRLHGAIFSFLAGTPAVTVSADPRKAEGVMEAVGLQDWVLAPTAVDPDQLYEQLIDATRSTTRAEIAALLDDAAERVNEAESTIESILRAIGNENRFRK